MFDILVILFLIFMFLIYKNIKDNNLKYTNFYLFILFLIYILSCSYLYKFIDILQLNDVTNIIFKTC